jgi:hypothetical protein
MRIPNKFNGYSADGRRLYNMGGGGGPNTTYSNTSNIPEYAQPYVDRMMQATEKQVYKYNPQGQITGFQPYKPYQGETVAGFSPMQAKAMRGIENYQLPGQTGQASDLAGYAGLGSMMAGQNYQSMATDPNATQAYMSPYIQNALNPMMDEARRQSDITGTQNAGQAVGAGAFGGSRFGIQEAARQEALGRNQAQIYGSGMQDAFKSAQQAQQFGSQLGLQGYGQGLQAAGQMGQLGQQQYGQEMGLLAQQGAVGKQQQDYEQARLNQLIQNYATEQQYPFIQLGTLSNMLRGLPMQASTTQMYQAQPSIASQMAGGIGTGLGLYQQYQKAFPGQGQKEGGVVGMANGGITNPYKLSGIAKKLSDPQLAEETKDDPMGVMQAEEARRKELRGMARGGIIAFAEGSKDAVENDEINKAADEGRAKNKILEAIGNVSPVRSSVVDERRVTQNKLDQLKNKQAAQEEQEKFNDRPENKGIRASLGNVSPMREGVAASSDVDPRASHLAPYLSKEAEMSAVPTPIVNKDEQDTTAASSGPSYRDREAANLEAGLSAAGIKPAKEANPLAELETTTNEEMLRQRRLRDESKGEKIKRYQKEREEANLPDPANKEREALEARKLRGQESEKETARNNLIRFLTRWGTIPGSALRGMIGAGAELVDKMDLDSKHREKFLNELDDIESKINSAEYARRLGDETRAREEQKQAGEQYFKLGHDLRKAKVDYAIKEMDNASKYEIAALKAEVAASKQQNKAAVIQMADKLMEGYIANGEPANAITYNKALENAAKMLPGVQAAGIAAGPASLNAQTNVTKAKTDADEAAIKAKKDAREATIAFEKAVRTKLMTDESVINEITKANKEDKTGKKAKEIENRVRRELAPEYGVNPPPAPVKPAAAPVKPAAAPTAPAAAPAKPAEPKKAEPKKAEPKKAEPKKEEGKLPAAAKPKLVWDPATGTWK